ncbi:MAG: hypothetical protein IH845_05390 [Nanoarchaeota archaeon]|nr:hypothetical protein [Nanoarchaeota archaeon]
MNNLKVTNNSILYRVRESAIRTRKIYLILIVGLFFSNYAPVSALSIFAHVPEKYTDIIAGERIYFEVEVQYPENPRRKDLILEYEVKDSEEKLVAQLKTLKAIKTQITFVDFIKIPEDAVEGLHTINVKVKDYESLSEEVSTSFQVVGDSEGQIMVYFLILFGVIVLIGILIIVVIFIRGGKR